MNAKTMPDEGFLRRWSRLKAAGGAEEAQPAPVPEPVPVAPQPETATPAPTLEDAARLTMDSDYSAFMAQGVDKAVRRLALKQLFADQHFKVMDGLDMYMDDYNSFTPLAPSMLAELRHARQVFASLLDDDEAEAAQPTPPEPGQGTV
jgi:hypothetical protein